MDSHNRERKGERERAESDMMQNSLAYMYLILPMDFFHFSFLPIIDERSERERERE